MALIDQHKEGGHMKIDANKMKGYSRVLASGLSLRGTGLRWLVLWYETKRGEIDEMLIGVECGYQWW